MRLYIFVIIVFFVVLFCHKSNAGLNVGTSVLITKYNNPDYQYDTYRDQFKISSLNLGYTKIYNKFILGVYSNRFINKGLKRDIKINGKKYYQKTKANNDFLQVGWIHKRFIPSVYLINSEIRSKTFIGKKIISKQNHFTTLGLGSQYIIDKNINLGLTYILPIEEMHTEGSIALSINFNI